ncbi:hypothetical protein [Magnetofaba australis]|uniref:hypothetical protein n=1 Tax=Magnetofaba australis TaxID=1472297 RepID=UPI00117FE168|nr:hypothetical protein [Magnetofaba australis]
MTLEKLTSRQRNKLGALQFASWPDLAALQYALDPLFPPLPKTTLTTAPEPPSHLGQNRHATLYYMLALYLHNRALLSVSLKEALNSTLFPSRQPMPILVGGAWEIAPGQTLTLAEQGAVHLLGRVILRPGARLIIETAMPVWIDQLQAPQAGEKPAHIIIGGHDGAPGQDAAGAMASGGCGEAGRHAPLLSTLRISRLHGQTAVICRGGHGGAGGNGASLGHADATLDTGSNGGQGGAGGNGGDVLIITDKSAAQGALRCLASRGLGGAGGAGGVGPDPARQGALTPFSPRDGVAGSPGLAGFGSRICWVDLEGATLLKTPTESFSASDCAQDYLTLWRRAAEAQRQQAAPASLRIPAAE